MGRSVGTARVSAQPPLGRVGRSGQIPYVCVVYKDLLQYTHTTTTHLHSSAVVVKTARLLGLTKCRAAPDSATLPAPCPGWVGRSGRPDSGLAAKPAGEGRSVGSLRPKIFFAALRAAVGRSGETESETQKTLKESRSARTLNVLSTSHRRTTAPTRNTNREREHFCTIVCVRRIDDASVPPDRF